MFFENWHIQKNIDIKTNGELTYDWLGWKGIEWKTDEGKGRVKWILNTYESNLTNANKLYHKQINTQTQFQGLNTPNNSLAQLESFTCPHVGGFLSKNYQTLYNNSVHSRRRNAQLFL